MSGPLAGDQLELWIERGLLAGQRLERIHPEPRAVAFGDGRFLYRFDVADPRGPFEIDLLPQGFLSWKAGAAASGRPRAGRDYSSQYGRKP